jgi:MGT family glycosyltransferase
MSKKILVMPDGHWLAHTSRPLEVAKFLRQLGHDVVFAGKGNYMELPRKNEFQIFPIITNDPEPCLIISRNGRVNYYSYEFMKECVNEEMKLFEKVKPDLVLVDWRHSASTSCELAGIPLASIMNAAWTNYNIIRINAPEHLKITQILGKQITTWFAPWIKNFILSYDIKPINKFRRHKGLKPLKNFWDVIKGDINLLVDIPAYGPTKNLPSNFYYVGPIFWEPDVQAPDWLEKLDTKRPTLYFTMGSSGNPTFFEQAIEIYGNTEYQCIITTAGMVKLTNVPNNFFVVDYAPGSKIMEKSNIVICHGGNGTIYQAMSKGVPIIGIPTMHDQEFNLDRVVDLGIGIHLSELKFQHTHLLTAVEKILTNKSYTENAIYYKNILESYNGPSKGAQIIDSYLENN